jgi:hypothetical protein
MIDRLHLLIFTPTYNNGLRHETVASLVGQQTSHWITWEVGRYNPYAGRDMRNVLAQYSYAREMCLRGPYDALLTVEHDMTLPVHAVQTLCDTPAPVVYGTYLLRQDSVLNAWRYEGTSGLGMSLGRPQYAAELQRYRRDGIGRVSGCGFGCTLIRRSVLEAIPFRQDSADHAPDMPFALDCVRKEILQLARFDVKCGHIHKETILEIQGKGEATTVSVTCIQSVNVMVDGGSMSLVEGETYEVSPENAKYLTDLGYVEVGKEAAAKPLGKTPGMGGEPSGPGSGEYGSQEGFQAPKVPRKPV